MALAATISLSPPVAAIAALLLADYAFGILCFLLGIWWGIGLMRGDSVPIVWSNILFIVLFVARATLDRTPFMLTEALLFVALLALERWLPAFRRQPPYYAALRTRLSLVACAALLLGACQHP